MNQTTTQIIKRVAVVSSADLALILTSGGAAIAAENQTLAMANPTTFERSAFPDLPDVPDFPDAIKDNIKDGFHGVKDGVNGVRDHWKDIARCARAGATGARVGAQLRGTVGPAGKGVGIVGGAGAGCGLALR